MVKRFQNHEDAVSEIVGEMLMLTLVLILLALFSSSLSSYLPPAREPSVTIRSSYDESARIVTLYHKGGDTIRIQDLSFVLENDSAASRLTPDNPLVHVMGHDGYPDTEIFDLGDRIVISEVDPGTVSLATSRAILYSGTVP